MPPAATVERLRPHFASLGITRLARQTGLDRIGMPCFAAIRPNALTLSVNQGKGLDDASAMASAIMEAAEYAIAEEPECELRRVSASEIEAEGGRVFDPRRLLPTSDPLSRDQTISWAKGSAWPAGNSLWLPFDAITLGREAQDLPTVGRSSNGLAAGNTTEEALFHAICELVERDATSLWSLLSDSEKLETEFSLKTQDADLTYLREAIAGSDLQLRLFDQTTDLGVPCAMAVIIEAEKGVGRRFDYAAGYGCHPVGERAVGRAITEAAQTRITNIAGSRDDFLPAEYFAGPDRSSEFLFATQHGFRTLPTWLPAATPRLELLQQLAERIGQSVDIAWAEMGGSRYGISVVRALSDSLEDREVNRNWRPGRRALRMMTTRPG